MKWSALAVQTDGAGGREGQVLVTGAADEADGTPPPLLANILLDRSGSMKGAPLAAAVEAVHGLVDRASERDHLGLCTFDGIVEQQVQPLAMTDSGKATLKKSLANLKTGKGTALHQAVLQGSQALGRIFVPGARPRLLLLTDGEPSVGPEATSQFGTLSEKLRGAGVSIHALGLAGHYVPEILAALTLPSGNGFEHADGPDGLSVALGALAANLYGELVTDVVVEIEPKGFRSLSCRHPLPSAAAGAGLKATLGALSSAHPRRVLFSGGLSDPEWSVRVNVHCKSRGDARSLSVPVTRAWTDSADGEAVVAVSAELDLVNAETAGWRAVAGKDFERAERLLSVAEDALRQLTAFAGADIPVRRHLERVADLRLAIERREPNVPLAVRRAASASSATHISQIMAFPKAKA